MKFFYILIFSIFNISKLFTQNNSPKITLLPKAAVEVVATGVGGAFALFTETGRIYTSGKVCEMNASVNCYGDTTTLKMYTVGIIGLNFKKAKEEEYNANRIKNSEWCCFKSESIGGGTLCLWASKFLSDIAEDKTTSYNVHLSWQGVIGVCNMYFDITVVNSESFATCETKAKIYLNEMIANAKKINFTKL